MQQIKPKEQQELTQDQTLQAQLGQRSKKRKINHLFRALRRFANCRITRKAIVNCG